MAQYAASKKVPAAKLGVLASGVIALLAGLSLILGVWIDLGAVLLVLFQDFRLVSADEIRCRTC